MVKWGAAELLKSKNVSHPNLKCEIWPLAKKQTLSFLQNSFQWANHMSIKAFFTIQPLKDTSTISRHEAEVKTWSLELEIECFDPENNVRKILACMPVEGTVIQ